jgi:hypothetical protein
MKLKTSKHCSRYVKCATLNNLMKFVYQINAVILQAIENNVAITVHTSFLQPHHSVQPTLDRLISLIQGVNA